MNDTLSQIGEPLHATFRQWRADEESLATEWNESLAALTAYQAHLDGWQQELVKERAELRQQRELWDQERADIEKNHEQSTAQSAAQLSEARENITLLTQQLLARSEELRLLDQRRNETASELEAARATAKQLVHDVEQHRRMLDHERAAWADQLQHLQGLLEQKTEELAAASSRPVIDQSTSKQTTAPDAAPPRATGGAVGERRSSNSPVLGSIVEQFGKLRQQRAFDRQTSKKVR